MSWAQSNRQKERALSHWFCARLEIGIQVASELAHKQKKVHYKNLNRKQKSLISEGGWFITPFPYRVCLSGRLECHTTH